MTESQERVYKAIQDYIQRYGYSPTIRELCELVGVSSPATIHFSLKTLKKKGFIDYQPNKNRTIRVLI